MKWKEDPQRRRGLPASVKRGVSARDGGRCHLCGHVGGVMHLDHVISHKLWTDQSLPGDPDDPTNLALAHAEPCPVCSRDCHHEKTQAEAKAAQSLIAAKATRPMPRSHPGLL